MGATVVISSEDWVHLGESEEELLGRVVLAACPGDIIETHDADCDEDDGGFCICEVDRHLIPLWGSA